MEGFYKRGMLINLTSKIVSSFDIDDTTLLKYSGGKGLATKYLLDYSSPNFDPLSEDAPLIIATGVVTGSKIWGSSRYGLFAKSPLTHFYAESYSGGKLPEHISLTGFDTIILTGKSEKLSYILINNNKVEIFECPELANQGTYYTEEFLQNKYAGIKARALTIGPAGENCVLFSVVENDKWRSAGRCGLGAVLGSKRIKAILFAGDNKRNYPDQTEIDTYSSNIFTTFKDSPPVNNYKKFGTPMMVALLNKFNAFPTQYWEKGYCDFWEDISADTLISKFKSRAKACKRCFIACGKLTSIREGKYKGITIEGPEYETIYAFGGLCLVKSLDEIIYLNDICDNLGIDTITSGNIIGYLIKLVENRKIDYQITWGDTDKIADTLTKIAFKKDIGKELSQGIKYLEKKYKIPAMYVKGLEPAGYDPRIFKGMALSYGTSDRGACHLRTTFYKPEISGIIPPEKIEGKAALVIEYEDRLAFFDSLILCRFFRDIYGWEDLTKIFNTLTGLQLDTNQIKKIASNIVNITRFFNIREGLTRDDDIPSSKFFEPTFEGNSLKYEDYDYMLKDYYKLRGW